MMEENQSNSYRNQEVIKNSILESLSHVQFDNVEYWDEIIDAIKHNKSNDTTRTSMHNLDPLTSLYDKEYTNLKIDDYIKNADSNQTHGMLLIDIHNFAIINKKLGYMFGDSVLVNLADSLKKLFYATDIIGRVGGDEFLIFLKNIDSREVMNEKLQSIYTIFNDTYAGEIQNYSLSCCAGMSMYPKDGLSFLQLFNAAHIALENTNYNNKEVSKFYDQLEPKIVEQEYNYFNDYRLTKSKIFSTNNFDNEMISYAFDLMSRTSDTKSAINLLLCKIKSQLQCTKVSIVERIILGTEYHITYTCSKNGTGNIIEHKDGIIASEIQEYTSMFNADGIISIKNINNTQLLELKRTILDKDTKAILQCGIFDNEELTAVFNIEDDKPRIWTKSEIDVMITITKIITSYLLKLRASEVASKQLYIMKNYDALTGLPTLFRFQTEALEIIQKNPTIEYGVLYIDINKFRHMNEMLGFAVGDKILLDFSEYLEANFKYESIARVMEDNFVLLIQMEEVENRRKEFLKLCQVYGDVHKLQYPSTKLIITSGIAKVEDPNNISLSIDNANLARRSNRLVSSNICETFKEHMKERVLKELEIVANMEKALKENEFQVYIQPKINLGDDNIVGGEALVRWFSNHQLISPADFIPIFEKNGFIIQLDLYIYETVFKKMREWMEQGIEILPISLNVSRIQLYNENFVQVFKDLVDKYSIPYEYIELELTESIFLRNQDIAITAMRKFRELGMKVSIDDFGAGYSSLNLLKYMATDIIKLDKEFFSHGDEIQKEEKIIVSSIIAMAKQLELVVVSEGVETIDQSQFLKSVNCDMAQGYLYARPMPMIEFEEMLKKLPIINRSKGLEYTI